MLNGFWGWNVASGMGDLFVNATVLAGILNTDAPTSVTATVGTTLSAAALSSGLINRTGPTAAYVDTTDTLAALLAAGNPAGNSFYVDIKNTTAFPQTLTGGSGVTFSSSSVIPANSVAEFLVTINAAGTAAVFNHVFSTGLTDGNPTAASALTTAGAGTVTAAGIVGGVTDRSGPTAAFADTTDIATAIFGAVPNAHVGQSFRYIYKNNSAWTATLGGGTNVTLSGAIIVPPNSWVEYLVTLTTATAVAMEAIAQGYFPTSGTVTANGVTPVPVANAKFTATSNVTFTMLTPGGTQTQLPFISSVTPGTGFSLKTLAGDTSIYSYEIRG